MCWRGVAVCLLNQPSGHFLLLLWSVQESSCESKYVRQCDVILLVGHHLLTHLVFVQVLLQGDEVQRVSAAWVASRVAGCASEADKAAAKSAAEFCQALAAAGAVTAVMDLLLSKEPHCKAAGGLLAMQSMSP
jgi:hypothetical protein